MSLELCTSRPDPERILVSWAGQRHLTDCCGRSGCWLNANCSAIPVVDVLKWQRLLLSHQLTAIDVFVPTFESPYSFSRGGWRFERFGRPDKIPSSI